jgi:hypothetical protein
MIDNHDLDGHGGHTEGCRQCLLEYAVEALASTRHSGERMLDGGVQVRTSLFKHPVFPDKPAYVSSEKLVAELKRRMGA